MAYDVARLMLLVAVQRTGSLSAAAQGLAFSTSAVSQQIAKLEREVGLALLVRQPRGVRLTEAGEILAAHAREIERGLAAAREDMADFTQARRGSVDIATYPTFAASSMPHVVQRFRERHPGIALRVRSMRLGGIREALYRHEVDVATLWDYPWAPLEDERLAVTTLATEPTKVLLPASHPLGRRRSIDLRDLAGEPWITRTAHPVSSVLTHICVAAGFSPRVSMETSDYQEMQGMVAAGLGVGIAPHSAILQPIADVRAIALKGNPAPRRILLARPAGLAAQPLIPPLLRIFRAVAREDFPRQR